MGLFSTPQNKLELPYVFTELEKVALKILPEELVKSTEHDEWLIEKLIDEEMRDAEWKHTISDAFNALKTNNTEKLLLAVKNITFEQKQDVVKQYYFSLIKRSKGEELTKTEAKHFKILSFNLSTDLIHLTLL